ncbi:protein FAR1-RELATED SEQUENCE 4-like [Melia azedarach]|uniref:Protein FAR1-RELATED SEQUENCE 4-like n=1 Tax=Melia azedarach TaxID=155640 RepID=A0ACC1YB89_MELAZ|nr:protein FAR1-RELATED SEQUENCE 4-like [Melia azedarach]
MALKNHFQFKVFKSDTTRFEAKCVAESCTWRVRAIRTNDDAFFRVMCIEATYTCLNEQLQYGHRQADIIAVDGIFFKGKFQGTLIVSIAQDGNEKIFPVAFGVVDSENDAS